MPLLDQVFGLCVRSTLSIRGAHAAHGKVEWPGETGPPVDVVIEEGTAEIGSVLREAGPYLLTPRSLVFATPGVARYDCSIDASRIVVEACTGASREDLSLMLIATALPAMLWMRGHIVLHAATVMLPGQHRAVAFVGRSGSGKSSLLKYLFDRGCGVVGDDAICLRFAEGKIEASGLPGCIFLRSESGADAERTAFPVPENRRLTRAELGAIVILSDWLSSGGEDWIRLCGGPALTSLLNHRHRAAIPDLLGHSSSVLQGLAQIVRRVPVYSTSFHNTHPMHKSDSFDVLRGIVEQLETGSEGGSL